MNLYLVRQSENNDYDTYDSMVVAAESEEAARKIHPSEGVGAWPRRSWGMGEWCSEPEKAEAELIGEAKPGTSAGVILASFNAG